MISWYYMVAMAALVAAFLLYKEWKRRAANYLWGRLTASLLAVISLLLMAYPFTDRHDNAAQKKRLLLTPGFIKDSVDNFIQKNNGAVLVFSGDRTPMQAGHAVELVTDWQAFATAHPADTFHVFGNGFDRETLAMLDPHPLVFHASPPVPAITSVYWKRSVETGSPLQVQGTYENTGGKKIKLVLQAFGVDKDSVVIGAGTRQRFELQTVPVHTGRAVYGLIAITGNDTLQKEPVPVEVQEKLPLQLLIVASSPDFDNTYLKNHLSQRGYQITIVTTISTNKTDKQFVNMPVQDGAGRLTGAYLNKFDVLLTDQETLQTMTAVALSAIRLAIQDKGMGLVIKMDAQKNTPAFYSKFFTAKALPPGKQSLLQLRSNAADSNQFQVKITGPVAINYVTGTQIVLQDAQSNIYASGVLYGSGKIITTTLQNTYSMALAGNQAAYQQLWWLLLNKAAKKIYPEVTWRTHPFIPYVNNPVQMVLEKNEMIEPVAVSKMYFKQDALLPFAWHGMYWPGTMGWQELPGEDTPGEGWYVYQPANWQSLMNYSNRMATMKYAALHPVKSTAERPDVGVVIANRQLYLLIIFLGCCIFLWVEQKIS